LIILELKGNTSSLEKSLMASLNGCAIPIVLTLLGPLRNWLYPKIFRSSRVTKATFTKTDKTKIIYLIELKKIIYRPRPSSWLQYETLIKLYKL